MVFGRNAKAKKYGHGGSVLGNVRFGDQTLLQGAMGDTGSGGGTPKTRTLRFNKKPRQPNLEHFDLESRTRVQNSNPSIFV